MNDRPFAAVDPAVHGPRRASGKLVTPERLIMAVFFLEAVLLTNWPPRIPDIEASLGLSHRDLALAMIGFVAMGLGVSIGFPLAVSAAAARGDRPPAANVAGVALFAYSSSLVGPTMVGFVADAAGLRIGFATVLPIMLSTLLAGQLRPGPRPAVAPAGGSASS